ncbi:MAG: hypothetical protein MK077_01775 [Phycisphaerales bacterium]|nr:hypothetical protein [Phycisphaerales bacterium]
MSHLQEHAATPARLSGWSIVSIVLAIGLCPVVTIVAIPAGLLALRDVRLHGRRGRRLAIVAMVLACLMTPVTSLAMWWWDSHVRQPLMQGPLEPLQAGQHGDIDAFLAGLGYAADADHRRTAGEFLNQLTRSMGGVQSMRIAEATDSDGQNAANPEVSSDAWEVWVPYDAMFQNGAARLHARFLLSTPTQGWVTHFNALTVERTAEDSLIWPPDQEGVHE